MDLGQMELSPEERQYIQDNLRNPGNLVRFSKKKRMEGVSGGFEESLGDILDRANRTYRSAGAEPLEDDLSVDARFGDSIQSTRDQVNQNAASSRRAIRDATLAAGGDVSGASSVALQDQTELANRSIGQAMNDYSNLNENMNQRNRSLNLSNTQFEKGRGDRFVSANLSGQGSLMDLAFQNMNLEQLREIQKNTANKQFWGGLIGGGLGMLGRGLNPNSGAGA